MNRLIVGIGALAMLGAAACGNTSAAGGVTSSTTTGSGGAGATGRNGAAGELVQVNGSTLVLNTQAGDVTVNTTATTTVQKTNTVTVADIVTGACIGATGTKDASGNVTANSVRLSDKVNGTCSLGGLGGGRGFGPGGGTRTPAPGSTPNFTPPPQAANFAAVRGEVTAVSGTSVSVQNTSGVTTTITVPTTVAVTRTVVAVVADLAIGECVQATGTKDSSGTVTARSLSIVPAGPSGCFTGGGFRRGGGGGGGGGFGGGGGAGAGASPGA